VDGPRATATDDHRGGAEHDPGNEHGKVRLRAVAVEVRRAAQQISTGTRRQPLPDVAAELRDVNPAMRVWVRGIGFAFVNWAADLLCLLVACRAVGVHASIDTMVVAYAIGMAAASTTPFLPAGLGVVDAALVLALRSGGVPAGAAVAADLVYRSVSFGLIALIGWGVYAVQRRGSMRVGLTLTPHEGVQ
jgi:uncharacterized protein (TIRG00374 family)